MFRDYIKKNISLLLLFSICSCCKDKDNIAISRDKQIRFALPPVISFNGSQAFTDQQQNIYKFNIDYFSPVDSAIYTVWSSVTGSNNKCTIELYNFTDNVPISSSLIEATSNTAPVLYQSSDIRAGFPHKEITLGLRIKGDVNGQAVNATSGYLYLYRK